MSLKLPDHRAQAGFYCLQNPFAFTLQLLFLFLCLAGGPAIAQTAHLESTTVYYTINGSSSLQVNRGYAQNNSNTPFNGLNLGTPTTLVLKGAHLSTLQANGGNVTSAALHYRIYAQGSPSLPAFTALNLPFTGNNTYNGVLDPNSKSFASTGYSVNVLDGLTPGTYVLEIKWTAESTVGTLADDNSGNNHKATFTVPTPTANMESTTVYYNMNGSTDFIVNRGYAQNNSNTPFNGINLGAPTSLVLRGAHLSTLQANGANVSSAALHYRIYAQGAGSLPAFTALNLPFTGNNSYNGVTNPNSKSFASTGYNVNVLQGLAPGAYVLEIKWTAESTVGTLTDDNNGNNHKATFRIPMPEPATAASNVGFFYENYNAMNLNWTNGNGVARMVVVRESQSQKALSFDGVDDYINVGNHYSFNGGSITVEAWVKPSTTAGLSRVFSKTGAYSFGFSNGQLIFSVHNVRDFISSSANIPGNEWSHLAVSFTGYEARFYVNGKLVSTVANASFAHSSSSNPAYIGSSAGTGEFFHGQLDEVRLWTTSRTTEQIQDNMFAELTGNESNLAGYYKLQEGNGSTAANLSTVAGTAANGTLYNFVNPAQASKFTAASGWVYSGAPLHAPVDGTYYPANAEFGNATSRIGSSSYVVYNSNTGNSVTVTNLTPNKNYFAIVYEYNGIAGSSNYKHTPQAATSFFAAPAVVDLLQTRVFYTVNNSQYEDFRAGSKNRDSIAPFNGANLGSVTSLVLNRAQLTATTFNGGDVTGGTFYYRVYRQNIPADSVPAFTALPLELAGYAPPDYVEETWWKPQQNINLLQGLFGGGSYIFEVKWVLLGNNGIPFADNNGGNNHKATFTMPAPTVTMSANDVYYELNGTQHTNRGSLQQTSTPPFEGQHFGIPASLILKGGRLSTLQANGANVTSAALHYRVYKYDTTTIPPAFTVINLPLVGYNGNGSNTNDRAWFTISESINLVQGLTPGNYVAEIKWTAESNIGQIADNNGGNNHKAHFTIPGAEAKLLQTHVFYTVNNDSSPDFRAGSKNRDNIPRLDSAHLGTVTSLVLNRAQLTARTAHGGDVTGGTFYYRVYPQSTPNASIPAFTVMPLELAGYNANNLSEEVWWKPQQTINLLQGLTGGNYIFEVKWTAESNVGQLVDDNNGNNHKATFTMPAPTVTMSANDVYYMLNGTQHTNRGSLQQTSTPAFHGQNLGTPASLILKGGRLSTLQTNGANVTAAALYYRVYRNDSTATRPGFTVIGLPFVGYNGNGSNTNDKAWFTISQNIDLMQGLAPGNYIAEIKWVAQSSIGEIVDDNGGNNHKATFTVPVPSVTMSANNVYYELNGTQHTNRGLIQPTSTPAFNGKDLGTPTSLILKGGRLSTLQTYGANATTATLQYRVYKNDSTATRPAFTVINLPFVGYNGNGSNTNDKAWFVINQNINLMQGLSQGTYVLEIKWTAISNVGTVADDNNGYNHRAIFRVPIYVSPSGNDANTGATIAAAKATVQAAINTVEEGGTIHISAGSYAENIVIDKNISFAGSGKPMIGSLKINGQDKVLTLADTIGVTDSLMLQKGTVVSNGKLLLASSARKAAIIDDFSAGYTGTITGNIQAQRFLPGYTGEGYHYLAAPVTGATLGSSFGEALHRMAYYDETRVSGNVSIDAGWVYATSNSALVQPMHGWSVFTGNNRSMTFTGTANTGSFSAIVTRTQTPASTPNGGFNVIGNPYPSAILWSSLWNLNNDANIHKTVYIWNASTGSTALYNFATNLTANGGSNEIASGQAFRIRRNTQGSSNFTINNSVRVRSANNSFLRRETVKVEELLRLEIRAEKAANAYETVIHSVADATTDIDANYDAEMIAESHIAQVYSKAGDAAMTFNGLPQLKGARTVALGVSVPQAGNYELSATEISAFAPGTQIYLEDRKLGVMQNLATAATYPVYLSASEANRFFLHFNSAAKDDGQAAAFINIYGTENEVVVQLPEAKAAQVTIINMLGQVIQTSNTVDQQQVRLKVDTATGAYIVRVTTENGTTSKKVMLSARN